MGERPIKRCLHECLWSADGTLLLYGGQTDGQPALGDLWTLDPQTRAWTRQEKPAPEPRQLYAAATLDQTAVIFGGRGEGGDLLDSVFLLDIATLGWTPATPSGEGPSARAGATLIADPARDRFLPFGGVAEEGSLGDVWEFRPSTS